MGRPKMTEEQKEAARIARERKKLAVEEKAQVPEEPKEAPAPKVAPKRNRVSMPDPANRADVRLPRPVSAKVRAKIEEANEGVPSKEDLDEAFAISDAMDEDHPQDHEPRPILEQQYLRETGKKGVSLSWRKFHRLELFKNKIAKWEEAVMPSTGKPVDSEGQRLLVTSKENHRKGLMRAVIDSRRQMGMKTGSIGKGSKVNENTEKLVRMTVQGTEASTL